VCAQAFILAVHLVFSAIEHRDAWIETFKPLARHVHENEPETTIFELCIADTNPLRCMVLERYSSKDAYTHIHRASAAFREYKAAQVELTGKPEITGQSYCEADFVRCM